MQSRLSGFDDQVFQFQIILQHLRNGVANIQRFTLEKSGLPSKKNPANHLIGMPGFFCMLMVDAFIELVEAHIFIHTRVRKVLIDGSQLPASRALRVLITLALPFIFATSLGAHHGLQVIFDGDFID